MNNTRGKKTFNDLLDVVCKALKDNILDFFEAGSDGIQRYIMASYDGRDLLFYEESEEFGGHEKHIEYIESLYTETFVIESNSDIAKVIGGAEVRLANGNKSEAESGIKIKGKNKVLLKGADNPVCILFLKGATVTQRRFDE